MELVRCNTLLAISYTVIPELRRQREEYERFWCLVGVLAVVGWVMFLLVNRLLAPGPRTAGFRRLLWAVGKVVWVTGAIALGGLLWRLLQPWSWGDFGAGFKWADELSICVLGSLGWLLAIGTFCVRRKRLLARWPSARGATHE